MTPYTDLQLDALRELANIGSGTAGTALAAMLGRPVDLSVPAALALPIEQAVEAAGDPESVVTAAVLPVTGDVTGVVLLLFGAEDGATVCRLLGVEPGSEWAASAIGEVGNILGTSYLNAIVAMTGLALEPGPPETATDMLAALVSSVLMGVSAEETSALLLDSQLEVEGEGCSMTFMLVPARGGVSMLLERLGVA